MSRMMQDLGIDRLSAEDRVRLIGEIWDSLSPDDQLEIAESRREELDRRIAAADADPSAGLPWEEVRARLRGGQCAISSLKHPMRSLADGLPPELAAGVHPDWRKNEVEYWTVRDQLLPQYDGRWVAFADGAVIAAGTRPVEVYHAARQSGRHPFVICVGREDEPFRMRRAIACSD
jgi:putative addiction module component (TIGR02574 family)